MFRLCATYRDASAEQRRGDKQATGYAHHGKPYTTLRMLRLGAVHSEAYAHRDVLSTAKNVW